MLAKDIPTAINSVSIAVSREKIVGEYPTLLQTRYLSLEVEKIEDPAHLKRKHVYYSCGNVIFPGTIDSALYKYVGTPITIHVSQK